MNRSLRKELLREIRGSWTRFLSILVMVALGVLFLVGLRSAAPDMRTTADRYFDSAQLYDVEVISTLGLTPADVEELEKVEGVEKAEGFWSLDGILTLGDVQKTVKLVSLSGDMDRPTITAGRMPRAADECVLDQRLMEALNVGLGDFVTLTPGEKQPDALSEEPFLVTGSAESPLYISLDRGTSTLGDGSVAGFVLLTRESFNLDYYTAAHISATGARALGAYSGAYGDLVEQLSDRLEPLAESLGQARYEQLLSEGQGGISDAQAELDTAWEDAQTELSAGREDLEQARKDLESGYRDLEDAQAEYDTALKEGQTELSDARNTLDAGWDDLDNSQRKYDAAVKSGKEELEKSRKELDQGWKDLQAARQTYNTETAAGKAKLDSARKELDQGWRELENVKATLDASQLALDAQRSQAEARMSEQKSQLDAGEARLSEQLAQVEAARQQAESLRQQANDYAEALAGQPEEEPDPAYTESGLAELEAAAAQAETVAEQAGSAYESARAELDAGWETYNAALAELDSAQAELDAGWKSYEENKATLDAGETAYQQNLKTYQDAVSSGKAELDQAEQTLKAGETAYTKAKAEYDTQTATGKTQLENARKELTQGEADYAQGKQDYETQTAEGREKIEDAQRELEEGEADFEQGQQDMAAAEAEAQFARSEAQKDINEARQQLKTLRPPTIYVLDRNSNYGFVSYDQNATRMENLARVFPLIFFLVAALVCLTTMTRMVEEQRTQIGAIKALGYGSGAIAGKYLCYGLLAALLGALLGTVIGATLIPWVIFTSYNIMYVLPDLYLGLYWPLILGAAGAGILCTLGSTLWAVGATSRQPPAVLMRPKAPRAGKRILLEHIGPVWRSLSFSAKVSARNLFRYKKRLWMTVIGVAGCTGLLIAGLGLRSSIFGIIDIQFGEIYRYNIQLTLDPEEPEVTENLEALLEGEDNVAGYGRVDNRSVTFISGDTVVDGYISATDRPGDLSRALDLRDMNTHRPVQVPREGVIIDQKLSEMLGVGVGDTITIDCGKRVEAPVTGVYEHYVYHYARMSNLYLETLTGEKYQPNEYLISVKDSSDAAVSDLSRRLMEVEGAASATNIPAMAKSFRETIDAVDAAVMVIILSAAALALVVLYNLTNINITERIRELATIKVLGFYDDEVAMYIYRENIVLTLMGIALGQVAGKFLTTWLIRTIEMDIVMFGREAKIGNYLLSILLSLLFAAFVNGVMYFRMKKIDMVQSLKSVE